MLARIVSTEWMGCWVHCLCAITIMWCTESSVGTILLLILKLVRGEWIQKDNVDLNAGNDVINNNFKSWILKESRALFDCLY